jgi:hypothetical protein
MSWVKNHGDNESSWDSSDNTEKQGRPTLAPAKKRKQRFPMNLNDEELRLIQAAAEETGQSQAAFSRTATLEKAKSILK